MQEIKIKLVALNSKYIHSSLGIWYLKAGLKEYCGVPYRCEAVESTINAPLESSFEKIAETDCDLIGFSTYIWNVDLVLRLAEKLKEEKQNTKILLGGPEVSYRAKEVLKKYPFVDFVLSGEGEKPIARLAEALFNKTPLKDVPGLSFKSEEKIFEAEPFVDEEDPPSPYCEEYFATLNARIAYIESSRGCPFSCAFCLSGRCGTVRFFELERVKRDIIALANSGAKTIKFVDRTFNANTPRAEEILEFIYNGIGKTIPEEVCFHFEIAGDILKPSTLEILKKMPGGAVQLEIGMQTFNEETLKKIHRKTNTERLKQNIKKLRSFSNIHLHIDLIAGLTGEDLNSFRESFNIAFELGADMLQMGFLKLLYGAEMRENTEAFPCTFSKEPPYEVTSTPWLGTHEITALKNTEDALERLYNSGRFKETLSYLVYDCGIEPFELFYAFGNSEDCRNMPLMEYIDKVYAYFKNFDSVDSAVLRDKLISDRLLTDSSANIPDSLKISDKNLKFIKKRFAQKGKKIGVAVLYTENTVISVDYTKKNRITNRYAAKKYPVADILNE